MRDYSRDGVLRSIEASLERLSTDRIDIVLIHDPDDVMDQAVRETAPALSQLRDEGVIGAYGAGMNVARGLEELVARTDLDVVMVAGRWTLLDRSAAQLLDLCLAQGVSVLSAAPFNSGLLAQAEPNAASWFDYEPASNTLFAQAQRLARTCRDQGVLLPQAALQFPLQHPAVASVVVGMRSAEEARSNVSCMTHPLPPSLWSAIERAD